MQDLTYRFWNDSNKRPEFYTHTNTSTPSRYYRGYYTLFNSSPWLKTADAASHSYTNKSFRLLNGIKPIKERTLLPTEMYNKTLLYLYKVLISSSRILFSGLKNLFLKDTHRVVINPEFSIKTRVRVSTTHLYS